MNYIEPRIEIIPARTLVGFKMEMSLINNRTHELWKAFMTRRSEIVNAVLPNLYSLQVYSPDYFSSFVPTNRFTKWALTEVTSTDNLPEGMEAFLLEGGQYAVFDQKGHDKSIFSYIYSKWVHHSNYRLDDRPHFEVLGEKYKNDDPNSEEEIWIPVKPK
ncbi:MAG: effector binding domain-containing protein [Bacteroidia bacterium]|nr:effector binding domain-containing protein [Bacteroidia bacterium]